MESGGASTLAASCLRNTIWQYLDQDRLDSAVFTAERVLAMDKNNATTKHLVGLVYYRKGQYQTAMNCTNNTNHVGCLYIYAQSCYKLKEYVMGITALEEGKNLYKSVPSATIADPSNAFSQRLVLPTPAMLHVLLAHMYKASDMDKKAALNYGMALRLDPFCWEATEGLCQMGIQVKTSALYNHLTPQIIPDESNGDPSKDYLKDPFISNSRPTTAQKLPLATSRPFAPPPKPKLSSSNINTSFSTMRSARNAKSTLSRLVKDDPSSTPTTGGSSHSSFVPPSSAAISKTPVAPPSSKVFDTPDTAQSHARSTSTLPQAPMKRTARTTASTTSSRLEQAEPVFAVPRRSSRLAAAATSGPTKKPSFGPPFTSRFNPPPTRNDVSPTAKSNGGGNKHSLLKAATSSTFSSHKSEALRLIISLYSTLTRAYYQFCKYQCDGALATLSELPQEQLYTPWVIAKQARLYFEKVQYDESLDYFEKLRRFDRYRQEDMEYYSTLLWHLQKDVDLTFLALDLVAMDRHSPQAWCAVGNALSLSRDTDNALKCFQRAVALDPALPYPYTLQAHEHVASDAYEHAQDCYRLALRADKRHYNAWYGLGMVFLRLGNNDLAKLHFQKAAGINPVNVVLICCIGMVLEKLNQPEASLAQYTRATELQPASALSLFKRARLLVKLGLYNDALADLDRLVGLAPDEASVHFLLGQIHKTLKNRTAAVREFTIALNLDPKGSHMIKEALEGMEE